MFTFLNTIEVLPTASTDFIHHYLADRELKVPVVLKTKSGMPGCIAVHAWIPMAEPVCRTLATELVVCPTHATELCDFLDRFVQDVRAALEIARNDGIGQCPVPSSECSAPPGAASQ